jgi:hypothetical protein
MASSTHREAVRRALAAGLRSEGLGVLCKDEPGRYELGSERFSYALVSFFALGDILYLASGAVLPPLLGVVCFFVLVLAIAAKVSPQMGLLTILAVWAASAIEQLLDGGFSLLTTTHLLPALVVIAVVVAWRVARFVRGVPLLLPVVLVVLFAPLLTADLWQVADDLGVAELVYVFGLSVLPFLLVLAPQLRRSARSAFLRAAEEVDDDPAAAEEAALRLEKAARESDPSLPEQDQVVGMLAPYFASGAVRQEAPEIQERISKVLGRRLLLSLGPLTLGLGLCVTFYIYLVAWALVPVTTVERWLRQTVQHETVPLLGDLPVGPYLNASVLLGILATAIFFAFVVTDEEKYASTLTDLVVRKPLRRAALFALPYTAIRREWGGPPPKQQGWAQTGPFTARGRAKPL